MCTYSLIKPFVMAVGCLSIVWDCLKNSKLTVNNLIFLAYWWPTREGILKHHFSSIWNYFMLNLSSSSETPLPKAGQTVLTSLPVRPGRSLDFLHSQHILLIRSVLLNQNSEVWEIITLLSHTFPIKNKKKTAAKLAIYWLSAGYWEPKKLMFLIP